MTLPPSEAATPADAEVEALAYTEDTETCRMIDEDEDEELGIEEPAVEIAEWTFPTDELESALTEEAPR